MAPRQKASIASSKSLNYNPRDLCHPEEIEAVEAECEEDDKQVEKQDLENGGSEFSPSQVSSQETDLISSQSTIHYVLSQSDDSEDAESQWTHSQSSQSYYEEDDAGDDFAEYKPSQIFQFSSFMAEDEPSAEENMESWIFDSSSPFEPNFALHSDDPETKADAVASR